MKITMLSEANTYIIEKRKESLGKQWEVVVLSRMKKKYQNCI